jgi:hypothetical protein
VRRNPPEAENTTLAGSRAALPSEQRTCCPRSRPRRPPRRLISAPPTVTTTTATLTTATTATARSLCHNPRSLSPRSALPCPRSRIRVTLGKTPGYCLYPSLYPAATPAPRPSLESAPQRLTAGTHARATQEHTDRVVALPTALRRSAIPSSYHRPLVILEKWGARSQITVLIFARA